MSVYGYASLCDFVYIALLLPFVLGFCLSVFVFVFFILSIVFRACYHWWICFLVWLLSSFFLFFSFFFYYFLIFLFLINIFYFNNFILFCFLSFFLPFLLSHVADRVWCPSCRSGLCLWGGRAEFTTLVHQRPPGATYYQMAKALLQISISTLRHSSTQRAASCSAGHPMPNNKQERNTIPPISREAA